ncbi:hypothetical protein SAMN02745247_00306 [Butyrivibrio hungatei DSM 14810]|uniref:Lipoprotein n=1 Tax=Butyrivibrio hungatei DSM 14810 TaxID=1121132 RepID=A0A1M7RT36_9FIRM|nr:hypothetical protein [Butyrivibrio hungatei]SHN49455.1 hypothetical protein SAMN02745247_00306 [Butyrivibrio hungatei DSM 14810]
MKQHKRNILYFCTLLVVALVLCSRSSNEDGKGIFGNKKEKKSAYDHKSVTYSELTEEDLATIDHVNQNSDMAFELMGEMQDIVDPMEGPFVEFDDGIECEGAYVQTEGKVFRTYIRLKSGSSGHHILGIHCEDKYKDAKELLEKAGFIWECDEYFNSYLNISCFSKGNVIVHLWVTSESPYEKDVLDDDLIQEVDIYIPMYHDETDTRMTE